MRDARPGPFNVRHDEECVKKKKKTHPRQSFSASSPFHRHRDHKLAQAHSVFVDPVPLKLPLSSGALCIVVFHWLCALCCYINNKDVRQFDSLVVLLRCITFTGYRLPTHSSSRRHANISWNSTERFVADAAATQVEGDQGDHSCFVPNESLEPLRSDAHVTHCAYFGTCTVQGRIEKSFHQAIRR